MPDASQEVDIVGPIIASTATALQRFDLAEPRLPEAQDMLRQVEVICDLANGTEGVRPFLHVPSPNLKSALFAVVDPALHDVRWLEHHDTPRLDRHFLASLRVASDSAPFVPHDERS